MTRLKSCTVLLTIAVVHVCLIQWVWTAFDIHGAVFAGLLNWLMMSWIALTGQFVSLGGPAWYFQIRRFEQSGWLYQRLGIRWFQMLVGRGPWTVLNPSLRFSGEVSRLPDLEQAMQKAEAGHGLAFVAVVLLNLIAALRGWWDTAAWLTLWNIPLNLCPVLLQRWNRARIQRIRRLF